MAFAKRNEPPGDEVVDIWLAHGRPAARRVRRQMTIVDSGDTESGVLARADQAYKVTDCGFIGTRDLMSVRDDLGLLVLIGRIIMRAGHSIRLLVVLFALVLTISLATFCFDSYRHKAIPITYISIKEANSLISVSQWRIIGAFPLPANQQVYTEESDAASLSHDYLQDIHGREAPLTLPGPLSHVQIDFSHDMVEDDIAAGSKDGRFINQSQRFPTPAVNTQLLFWHSFYVFKVTYAAAELWSKDDRDVVFILSSNSPIKLWLNNEVIGQSRPGSVGHDWMQFLGHVHLRKGGNFVLLKIFCFPIRNDFALRIASPMSAHDYMMKQMDIVDVIDKVFVPQLGPLMLSRNLRYFAQVTKSNAEVIIRNVFGRPVLTQNIDLIHYDALPLTRLSEGFYSILVSIGSYQFSEDFYLGDRMRFLEDVTRRCRDHQYAVVHDTIPCTLVNPLQSLIKSAGPSPRLDRDLKILMLMSQIVWSEHHIEPTARIDGERRFQLISYRSPIDDDRQYYYLHLPPQYAAKHPIPLVIEMPFLTDHRDLFTGPPATAIAYQRKFAYFADEFGYAVIIPYTRGPHEGTLTAADILASLADVKRRYSLDPARIYLSGLCDDGRNAILLAEELPDVFAAVSARHAHTGVEVETGDYWFDSHNPFQYIQNLGAMPILLVHGDYFPHSPTAQAFKFKDQAQRVGKVVRLELVPRDGELGDDDMIYREYQFFKGKSAYDAPRQIAFSTRCLKFNTDHWLRIDRVIDANEIATVRATWESPSKIIVNTNNVGVFSLIPSKFPAVFQDPHSPQVIINGVRSTQADARRHQVTFQIAGRVEEHSGSSLYKNEYTEGPIPDAFASKFLVIRGTGGSRWQRQESSRLFDEIVQAWHESYHSRCRNTSDQTVGEEDLRNSNLIVVGKIGSNRSLMRIRNQIPFVVGQSGMIIGDQHISGKRLIGAMIYPSPTHPKRYVVVIDFNTKGDLARPDLATSANYDVMTWDFSHGDSTPAVNVWYWDANWVHLH